MSEMAKFAHSVREAAKGAAQSLREPKVFNRKKLIYPVRAFIKPFDTFSDIKSENMGSMLIANVIIFLFFVTSILEFFFKGFIFNDNKLTNFNILVQLAYSVVLVVLWSVTNWAVCTLMDGEGTMSQIWIVTAYSLMPLIISRILTVMLSNFLVFEESVFLTLISGLGMVFLFVFLFVGSLTIHQYTVLKTLISMAVTVLGILAIIFLFVLFFSIIQQMYGFITTVSTEVINKS